MIELKEITVRPNYSSFYVISWTLMPTTEDLADYVYEVYSAPSASTPSTQRTLLSPQLQATEFVYEIPTDLDSSVHSYFSVDITKISTSTTWTSSASPVAVYMVPRDNYADAIIYQEEYFLDYILNRDPVKLITRKRTGAVCTNCVDELTGEVTKSACSACYSTGLLGGYNPPVTMMISFTEPGYNQRFETTEVRDVQNNITTAWTKNYPLILPGDFFVDAFNRRFKIIQSLPTTKDGRIYLRQNLQIQLVPPKDIIYKVEV